MIARHLLIGLVALTALSSSQALAQAVPCRNLQQPFTSLSDDVGIRLIVQDCEEMPGAQRAYLLVQLYGGSRRTEEPNPKPLSGMAIQVWLLRADGTAMDQWGPKPWKQPGTVGLSNAGSVTDIMSFTFEHTDPKELVGVVVNVNGKLFVREIK